MRKACGNYKQVLNQYCGLLLYNLDTIRLFVAAMTNCVLLSFDRKWWNRPWSMLTWVQISVTGQTLWLSWLKLFSLLEITFTTENALWHFLHIIFKRSQRTFDANSEGSETNISRPDDCGELKFLQTAITLQTFAFSNCLRVVFTFYTVCVGNDNNICFVCE